jgi:polar amino acid transport system substrate-binding protein
MLLVRRFLSTHMVALMATALGVGVVHADEVKVPDELRKAGQFNVGVKCDSPPSGYLDEHGTPTGIDIDFSRYIAELAFGDPNKAVFTCVTSATRVQMLNSGKVDVIIATMGVTEERKKSVDYATSSNWGGSGILVRAGDGYKSLDDFNGKTLLTNKGSWQADYIEKNYPKIQLTKFDSITDAIQAFRQGRGDGVTQDVETLIPAAEKDPGIKVADISFQIGWAAPAVRRGDKELRLFMDEMVLRAKKDGTFEKAVNKYTSGLLRKVMVPEYTALPPDGSSAQNTVLP